MLIFTAKFESDNDLNKITKVLPAFGEKIHFLTIIRKSAKNQDFMRFQWDVKGF